MENASRKKGEAQKPQPIRARLVFDQTTLEALVQSMQDNPRGCIMIADEAATWIKNFNQYRAGAGADQETYLTIFSGKPLDFTRKSAPSVRVQRPFLSIIGTIQPSVLAELMKGRESNGFVDRLLLPWPSDAKVAEYDDEDSEELPEQDLAIWGELLKRIRDVDFNGTPTEIPLSPEAKALYIKWHNVGAKESNRRNADKLRRTDDDIFAGIQAKMDSYCLRFSLILEVLWQFSQRYDARIFQGFAASTTDTPHVEAISLKSMQGAILLSNYFRAQALEARKIGHAGTLELLTEDKRKLYEALPDSFTRKQALTILDEGNFRNSTRALDRLLKCKDLFRNPSRGEYIKQNSQQ